VIVVVLIVANIALEVLDRAVGGARVGPESSTYTTDGSGLAAYADLLRDAGHRVRRIREPLADAELERDETLFVFDAALDEPDRDAVQRFFARGGTLVVGGSRFSWLSPIVSDLPRWTPAGDSSSRVFVPSAETHGVTTVMSTGGLWSDAGGALPVVGTNEGALLAVRHVARGTVFLLATSSPLQNRSLDDADNAALGLGIAGERERPVAFAERPHGYSQGTGFAAIPIAARWAIAGLALAALLWLLSRGRRLGPPQLPARELAPPRRAYVEAVASTLARTKMRADAVASLQLATKERIERRTGVRRDAPDDEIVRAAMSIGLSSQEASAIVQRPADDAAVVEVGRAFAHVGGDPRR
jgi:hypothetical protein